MFALPCEAPESAANGLAPVTRFLLRIPRSRNHPPRGVAWADTGWLPRVPCDCCHGTGAPPARRLQSPGAAGSAPRGVQVQPCQRGASWDEIRPLLLSDVPGRLAGGPWSSRSARALPTRGPPGPGWAQGGPRPSVLRVGLDPQDGMQLLRREPQQVLQVADEAVHVALARRLVDDVLVVIVA